MYMSTWQVVPTWDGVLYTSEDCSFQENPPHLDAKGCDYVQCEVVLWLRLSSLSV